MFKLLALFALFATVSAGLGISGLSHTQRFQTHAPLGVIGYGIGHGIGLGHGIGIGHGIGLHGGLHHGLYGGYGLGLHHGYGYGLHGGLGLHGGIIG